MTEEFDGTLRRTVTVRDGKPTAEVRLTLDLAETIAGWALDPALEPIAGILVWLSPVDPVAAEEANVVTGADGAFEFRGLERGLYRLNAYPTSIGRQKEAPYLAIEELEILSGETDLELVLEAAAQTSGRVLNGNGTPAYRASVVTPAASPAHATVMP